MKKCNRKLPLGLEKSEINLVLRKVVLESKTESFLHVHATGFQHKTFCKFFDLQSTYLSVMFSIFHFKHMLVHKNWSTNLTYWFERKVAIPFFNMFLLSQWCLLYKFFIRSAMLWYFIIFCYIAWPVYFGDRIGLKIFVWIVYSFSHYIFKVCQDCELFPHYMLRE